jgi:hypothetical protein
VRSLTACVKRPQVTREIGPKIDPLNRQMRALAFSEENTRDLLVADQTPPGRRLDSWKAIAEYLQRDVGTVRRWEKLGLPVRRVPGGRGRSVFAYASEIDQWLTAQPTEPGPAEAGPPAGATEAAARRSWPWPALIAAGAIVAAVLWWSRAPQATSGDLAVEVLPAGIVVRDGSGQIAWRHDFPETHVATPSNMGGLPRVVLRPSPAIYAATSYRMRRADDAVESGELMRFTLDGRLDRVFAFDDDVPVRERPFGPPWAITTFAVGSEAGAQRVAVAAHHYLWDPSLVTILDEKFQRRGTFVHEGWIEGLAWIAPTQLLMGGFSHPRDGGMVGLLDTQSPALSPTILVVMPRSEVNRASGSRFNRAIVQLTDDRVIARTIEIPEGDPPAEAIFEFDRTLKLLNASFSDSYRAAHRRLEAKGALDHPLEKCPDAGGPREIQVWRPDTGWRIHPVR